MGIKFKVRANSSNQESDLIWNKIENIDFFRKHNYTVSLPNHQSVSALISKSMDGKLNENDYIHLSQLIKNEIYNEIDYKSGINIINSCINKQKLNFECFQNYNKHWSFKFFNDYKISLTLYGPGGEYRPSDGEIIMLTTNDGKFRRGSNPLDTIIHEMVHIGIEDNIIQRFSIPHKIKEQIVDIFVQFHFKQIIPNYQIQNFGRNDIKNYLKTQEDWNDLIEVLIRFEKEIGFESA
jgi:hypothetical protein